MLKEYESAFKSIYKVYGELSPEKLIKQLQKSEGDNFTTYQCNTYYTGYVTYPLHIRYVV